MKHVVKQSVFAAGLALSLGACQHTAVTEPSVTETVARNEVRMVRLPYTIAAEEDGSAAPTSFTLNGINLFLRSVDAGYADVILIDAPDVAPERLEAIAAYIGNTGLAYGGTAALGARPAPGQMTIYVERHIVIPPNCHDWKPETDRNNPSARLGCSLVTNLGLMVANPRDLVAGQRSGTTTSTAVGAIYTPKAKSGSPAMTLSLEGFPDSPNNSGGSDNR